jgi:hypothetical protein
MFSLKTTPTICKFKTSATQYRAAPKLAVNMAVLRYWDPVYFVYRHFALRLIFLTLPLPHIQLLAIFGFHYDLIASSISSIASSLQPHILLLLRPRLLNLFGKPPNQTCFSREPPSDLFRDTVTWATAALHTNQTDYSGILGFSH